MKIELDSECEVLTVNGRKISLHLLANLVEPDPERFFRIVERDGVVWAEKFARKSLEGMLTSVTSTPNPL